MRQSKLLPHLSSPQMLRRGTRKAARRHAYVSESSGGSSDEDIAAIPLEPKPEPSQDRSESSEDELRKPSLQKPSSPLKRTQRICLSDDDSASSPSKPPPSHLTSHSDSDSEVNLPRKGKVSRAAVLDSDEDLPRKKSRLLKGIRPDSPEPDPTEELDENVILDSRMRERGKKSQYLQNLEKLKRKKQGLSPDDDSGNECGSFVPFEGSRPEREGSATEDDAEESDNESDFIVEDNGAPVDLPGQFSRHRHRDLSESFKIVCQLFVHVALQPLKDRRLHMSQRLQEEYFCTAKDDLAKKMSAILTQTVTSQVWKKPFLKALAKYPDLILDGLEEAIYYCDACNSSRKSTVYAILSGKPYEKIGFEPLDDDTDVSEEESEDDEEETQFTLGRFCAARAKLHHSFSHWEYKLFRSLEEEVSPVPSSQAKDGDAVMERLVKNGVIEHEFQNVKRLIRRANNESLDDD